ncbi:hypothetical protein [Comamonas koreensis]|uniref:Uncharacterized protein n=1 Tax=Comamonas koreensis TaxID=160825 RepID=A0AAW4XV87_9BURK|nr:hypothetical protein [Comamonas koreensis]MCD2164669.1 hypothetical protein [Comamonas koreensis]
MTVGLTKIVVFCALSIAVSGCGNPHADQISKAKSAVGMRLKDPESARFGEAFVVVPTEKSDTYPDLKIVCGRVNAKNSYGGYTGEIRFIVWLGKPEGASSSEVLEVEMEKRSEDNVFTQVWWGPDCSKHKQSR